MGNSQAKTTPNNSFSFLAPWSLSVNFLTRNKVLEGARGKGRGRIGECEPNNALILSPPRSWHWLFFMFLQLPLKALQGGKKQIVASFCVMSSSFLRAGPKCGTAVMPLYSNSSAAPCCGGKAADAHRCQDGTPLPEPARRQIHGSVNADPPACAGVCCWLPHCYG